MHDRANMPDSPSLMTSHPTHDGKGRLVTTETLLGPMTYLNSALPSCGTSILIASVHVLIRYYSTDLNAHWDWPDAFSVWKGVVRTKEGFN